MFYNNDFNLQNINIINKITGNYLILIKNLKFIDVICYTLHTN